MIMNTSRDWREWSPNWPDYESYAQEAINVLSKPGVLTRAQNIIAALFNQDCKRKIE